MDKLQKQKALFLLIEEETDYICENCMLGSVDHDHDSGKIRGLLCNRCNLILGQANDSVDLLKNLINYLTGGHR